MTIKPLQWTQRYLGVPYDDWNASIPFTWNVYCVFEMSGQRLDMDRHRQPPDIVTTAYVWCISNGDWAYPLNGVATMEEGKAACQADYERRMMEYLVP